MNFGLYGTTWWGKKWLESLLESVDPKVVAAGLRYAQKGQVQKIDLLDNRIMAETLGPAGGKHNHYLVFPKFPKEKADLFVNLLKQQPSDLLALSNGAMNPSMELLLSKSELSLFDSVGQVQLNCDCKDALPCKYIVACLLKIAEQIDENPFVLFRIHGLEIEHLKDYKPEQIEVEVPKETALVRCKTAFLENRPDVVQRVPELDVEQWQDYSRILPGMLCDSKSFCPSGDFRKSYIDEQDRCREFYLTYKDFDTFTTEFSFGNRSTFLAVGDSLKVIHRKNWSWNFVQMNEAGNVLQQAISPYDAMQLLCALPRESFSRHHISVRYLHCLLVAAFYFIRTGAIYPQIFSFGRDSIQIRWLPAEMLPDILSVVSLLEKYAPKNIAQTAREEEFLEIQESAEHILSIFIVQLISLFRRRNPLKHSPHENLLKFFFNCISAKLNDTLKKILGSIQQWFSVYNSLDFRTPLLFSCSEAEDEIALEIFVLEHSGRIPLSKIYEDKDPRLLSIVSILRGIGETFKPLNDYMENHARQSILMSGSDLKCFMDYCLKKLEFLGIQAELPQSLLRVEKPKFNIRLQGSIGFGAFNAEDLLDFDWEVALGENKISAEEFLRLAEQADGMLKYNSTFVR
ncbi:MAG: hypothetical protein HUK20_07190, partial [Fibrobacter sp.]|nr:hypothetical protein [Fibrobacter sp.]